MKLSKTYEHKTVRLIDINDDAYEGYVGDYIYPEDNEPEEVASIVLDYPVKNGIEKISYLFEFTEKVIKSIEIIS